MKTTTLLLSALALGASIAMSTAQDNPPPNPPPGEGPGHRPPPPLIAALDANHDGVIDAAEIANASAALKTLDKNGDGQLTMDEIRPPRGPGGPGGPGGGDQQGRHRGGKKADKNDAAQ